MENPLIFSGETMEIEQQWPKLQSGEKSELLENFGVNEEVDCSLCFSEKAREKVALKFQESGHGGGAESENLVSMDVIIGAIALMECSEKAQAELIQKQVQCSVPFSNIPLRILYVEVPKKQRTTKGKPMTIPTGDGYLKKYENPILKNSESISSYTERIQDKLEPDSVPLKQCSEKRKTLASATMEDFDNAVSDLVLNFKRKGMKRYRESEDLVEENPDKSKKQKGETKQNKRYRESEELVEENQSKSKKQEGETIQNKRCREIEELVEKNQSKSKKQKGEKTQIIQDVNAQLTEWGLIPPPIMPDEFKTLIESMGGSEEKLLFQKIIYRTDLSKRHNRLQIPASKVTVDFLTETEMKKLEGKGMDVLLVEPKLKVSTIHLTKWNMKNSQVYVFNKQWYSVVEGNETLKQNTVMQIWSFRTAPESKLCFAMVNVREGRD